ncbi:uncharacterized protein LOC144467569 [Augochlora pura]
MKVLRLIFKLITLCGCWRPSSWDPIPWRYLYNVYTVTCFMIIHLALFGGVLDLVLIVDNQNDLSENLYKTTAFAVDCYKLASMLAMRENIAVLMDTLESEPFAPVGDEELEIRTKFDKSAERTVRIYTTALEVWSVFTVLASLLTNFASRKLLYRVWLPFEYTSATMYSLVYLHHALVTIVCVTAVVAYDGLFAGLLVHIYSQFEILRHRLHNIHRNENDLVKHCAHHHDQIYKLASMVNDEFKTVMLMQFLMSSTILCFDLYQLTLTDFDTNLADIIMYATCALMQVFYYCWFGNEVKLKSLEVPDMIFESEWTSLSNKTKKILLMMMRRATVPIEFSSLQIVTVNLETFKALLKMSYSVFSLLQQNQVHRGIKKTRVAIQEPVIRLIISVQFSLGSGSHRGNYGPYDRGEKGGRQVIAAANTSIRRGGKSRRVKQLDTGFFTSRFEAANNFRDIEVESRWNRVSLEFPRMHKLPLSFMLLTCVGYWRPTTWSANSLKYWLYNAYSIIMIFLLYIFTFYALVDAIISEDLHTTTDKFSLCISVMGVCIKVANLFIQREKIVSVVNSLLKKIHVPRDEEEMAIQRKFDNHARKLTLYCEVLNESAASFGTVAQVNRLISTRSLPVSNWAPYDLSSPTIYVGSWIQQTLSLMVCANTSVAHETLISGLMIQISAQFEIFCHRAKSLPALLTEAERESVSATDLNIRRKKILKNLIDHQLRIYKFAHSVNTVFQYMILLQFMVSCIVLCLTIYKMSTAHSLDVNFAWSLSYLCSMLMQVYLYCWYGNEVTLKSTKVCDAIYQMDWTTLPVSIVKDLLMIMMRSRKPVKMSSAQVITLSTESFVTIIKMSYSSFNILKDSSK